MSDQSIPIHHSPGFLRLAEEARQKITEIDADQFLTIWPDLKKRGGLLLDVREDHEWSLGHIPDAQHLGRGILERDIESLVADFNTPLVVYCGGGYRSALAAESLLKMGYGRVQSLAGGYRNWISQNKKQLKPNLG